ncbi:hypothetical protein EDD15DRAFT_2197918 [Pisolithus albus]|nr:hypothetical protein EDD15DRAFT_2197918 [Pisolithus albus]
MDPVCGISPAQIGLFPGPMGLSAGQSWVVSGFPQAKYITFKGILGHPPGSRGILQEVFASGGGITKEDGMGSLRASLMVVRVNAGYRSFPELRDHDKKSPQSLQGTWKFGAGRRWGWRFSQLEIPQGGQMGLGILQGGSWRFPRVVKWGWGFSREAVGDSPVWSNGVGDSPGWQLEIPQDGQMGLEILQGGSWRFPREQLEIPQGGQMGLEIPLGAVGDSPGGSWGFPRVVTWGWGFSRGAVGDSPGWSNGVGDSPGSSWRFPRGQLEIPQGGQWRFPREQLEISQGAVGDFPGGSWRFPRGQLEISQGAVGDFPGGSWRFPMVAKWVGDSPGGSKEVGGSPLGAILVNVAVSTHSVV